MGNEALHAWARRQAERKEKAVAEQPGVQRKEKKTSIGTKVSGFILAWKFLLRP
jgi:hypothetical protein